MDNDEYNLGIKIVVNSVVETINKHGGKLPWDVDLADRFFIVNKTLLNNLILTLFIVFEDGTFEPIHITISKEGLFVTSDYADIDPTLSMSNDYEEAILELKRMSSGMTHLDIKDNTDFVEKIVIFKNLVDADLKVVVGVEKDMIIEFNTSNFIIHEDKFDYFKDNLNLLLCDITTDS